MKEFVRDLLIECRGAVIVWKNAAVGMRADFQDFLEKIQATVNEKLETNASMEATDRARVIELLEESNERLEAIAYATQAAKSAAEYMNEQTFHAHRNS